MCLWPPGPPAMFADDVRSMGADVRSPSAVAVHATGTTTGTSAGTTVVLWATAAAAAPSAFPDLDGPCLLVRRRQGRSTVPLPWGSWIPHGPRGDSPNF